MSHFMSQVEQAERLLQEICAGKAYIVGAGEMGQYLGEYLQRKELAWEAYVDLKGDGTLNEHAILPYDKNSLDISASYIISSPQSTEAMLDTLRSLGVKDEHIYCFEHNGIIYELYGKINTLMQKLLHGAYRESSFGERDADKVYMIMERSMIFEGILSNVRRFLMGIDYADRHGFIPVIDQVYYPAFEYQDYDTVGIDNPWEYFFKQPGGVALDEVIKDCKHVRYYNMDDSVNVKYLSEPLCVGKNHIRRLSHWHALAKKYIHFTDALKAEAEAEYQRMFHDKGKVLGVKIREGMTINIEKKCNRGGIAYQPDIEMLLEDSRQYMVEWGCQYLYLMCETTDVVQMFQEAFGDKLLYAKRRRVRYDEFMSATELKRDTLHNHATNKREKAKEYLIETYLLMKCDALLSGDNGATEFACVMKGGYDYMRLYSYGYTPNFTAK